jgi:hypothetical protein
MALKTTAQCGMVSLELLQVGSVQSFSHIWFGLSGARHWLKR